MIGMELFIARVCDCSVWKKAGQIEPQPSSVQITSNTVYHSYNHPTKSKCCHKSFPITVKHKWHHPLLTTTTLTDYSGHFGIWNHWIFWLNWALWFRLADEDHCLGAGGGDILRVPWPFHSHLVFALFRAAASPSQACNLWKPNTLSYLIRTCYWNPNEI